MGKAKASELIERADEREQFLNQAHELLKARAASGGGPWPVMDLPLGLVDIERNHRTQVDQDKLQELAGLIESRGQEIPVRVHLVGDDRLVLIYGHRRLAALKMLAKSDERFSTIRTEVLPEQTAAAVQEMQAIENLHRVNLTPVEEAVAVCQLLKLLGDRQLVADRLGKSLSWVADRVYLSRLCQPVLDLVSAGVLPLAQAREIARLGDQSDQIYVAGSAINAWHWSDAVISRIADEASLHDHLVELPNTIRAGGTHIASVDEVKKTIAERTRSLKVVGWSLDQPIDVLPPCIGCRHNTKSDPVLFAGSVADGEPEQGFCMSQHCFDQKKNLVELAKQDALKAVKKIKSKAGDKAGLVREAVANATPAGVKPATVERFVKAQLDKPASSGSAGKASKTDPRLQALEQYIGALLEWRSELCKRIIDPLSQTELLGLYFLVNSDVWSDGRYQIYTYGVKAPYLPPDMPIVPAAAIHQAVKLIRGIKSPELTKLIESSDAHFELYDLRAAAPNFLAELARALGIHAGDKPMPNYDDFLPEELRAARPAAAEAEAEPESDSFDDADEEEAPAEPVKRGRGRPRKSA